MRREAPQSSLRQSCPSRGSEEAIADLLNPKPAEEPRPTSKQAKATKAFQREKSARRSHSRTPRGCGVRLMDRKAKASDDHQSSLGRSGRSWSSGSDRSFAPRKVSDAALSPSWRRFVGPGWLYSHYPYAVYKHPVSGDVLACEQNRDVYGAAEYAACKNEIESRGYVRVGTEQREISAKTGVDYTTPRPLPAK